MPEQAVLPSSKEQSPAQATFQSQQREIQPASAEQWQTNQIRRSSVVRKIQQALQPVPLARP